MSRVVLILVALMLLGADVWAGGISVDAGITPPQGRFILRTQYRYMSMDNSMMAMNTHMVPVVLAYGATPAITVMGRGMYKQQSSSMATDINNGLNDPFLLTKFRLYRKNTASYVIGIAPHVASNVPIGSTQVSNRTWNPQLGLNFSYRPRFLTFDLSAAYEISDISGKLPDKSGNSLSLNTAVSGHIPLINSSDQVISPVIEGTFLHFEADNNRAENNVLFVSPGVSYIYANLSVETLVQVPVAQSNNSGSMSQNSRFILGMKYMF